MGDDGSFDPSLRRTKEEKLALQRSLLHTNSTSSSDLLSHSSLSASSHHSQLGGPTKGKSQLTDFQIRVHIIEARDLKGKDASGQSDPVCFVSIYDKQHNTAIHKQTTVCTFDHLFFFSFKLLPEEFIHGKIYVKVFDANTIFRNELIGSYEFDIRSIYNRDDHELYRQWVALSNEESDGIQGFLRLSITTLGPDDTLPVHDEEEDEDDDEEGLGSVASDVDDKESSSKKKGKGKRNNMQSMVLMPPKIKTTDVLLILYAYRAEGLPKMDTFGSCDGFVVVKFGSASTIGPNNKTEVIKNTYNPVWNEAVAIPITLPSMTDSVLVEVYDYDAGQVDEIISRLYFSMKDLQSNPTLFKEPRWYNIYGAPKQDYSRKMNAMNKGYIEATQWRGRVMLGIEAKTINNSSSSNSGISTPGKHRVSRIPTIEMEDYLLLFDLYEANEIPIGDGGKVWIEAQIGNTSQQSDSTRIKNGNGRWFFSFKDQKVILPKIQSDADYESIPDVFVNIHRKRLGISNRFGYVRIKPSDFLNLSGTRERFDPKWHMLHADIFCTDIDRQQIAGVILFSISLVPISALGRSSLHNRIPVKPPPLRKYQLRGHIYQGKNIPAADDNGSSDPFCVVRVGSISRKTEIKNVTCFPMWYETVVLEVDLPEPITIASDVNVSVYDKDRIGSDFLGRFSVPTATLREEWPGEPRWYPIYERDPEITEGEVLASFQLIPIDRVSNYPLPVGRTEVETENHYQQQQEEKKQKPQQPQQPPQQIQQQPQQPVKKSKRERLKGMFGSMAGFAGNVAGTVTGTVAGVGINVAESVGSVVGGTVGTVVNVAGTVAGTVTGGGGFIGPESTKGTISIVGGITPELRNCILEIRAVCLRKLLPFRLRQIQNPFIEFDCSGVSLKTKSSNIPSGDSPNILEIVRLPVKIPVSPLYSPSVTLKVFDDRVLNKPLIGTTTIALSDFLPWLELLKLSSDEGIEIGVTRDDMVLPPKIDVIPGAGDEEEPIPVEEEEEKTVDYGPGHDEDYIIDINESYQQLAPTAGSISLSEEESERLPLLGRSSNQMTSITSLPRPTKPQSNQRTLPDVMESFFSGGEDEDEESEEKDLRPKTGHEYEHSMKEMPFTIFSVYRGKQRGLNFMERKKKKKGESLHAPIGFFKGKFTILEMNSNHNIAAELDLKELYRPRNLIVRLYILRGYQLVASHSNSTAGGAGRGRGRGCNPYCLVKAGKDFKITDAQNAVQDTTRPQFYNVYDIPLTIPDITNVSVEVWDKSLIRDELIGRTSIDLENRWFSEEWQSHAMKPIEHRTLWNPASSNPQGKLEMWVDIFKPEDAHLWPKIDIKPPPPMKFELRVIIWNTKDVAFKDNETFLSKAHSDIFIRCYPEGQKPQRTDVHYNSDDGIGMFNWRMKWELTLPTKVPRFKIQVWDKDFVSPNEIICEANMNLRQLFKRAFKKRESQQIKKQWISMTHPNADGVQGQVEMSVELLTEADAMSQPNGLGRTDPNQFPYLPEPDRPERSFNPLRVDKLLTVTLWNAHKFKFIGCGVCCLIFAVIIVLVLLHSFFNIL